MIVAIKYGDLVRCLQQHRWALGKDERPTRGPTLIARVRVADALEPEFSVLFHDLHRLRLQDRIGMVSDKLEDVAGPVRPALPVDQRRRPRCQRLEPGYRMVPYAREIRDGRGALLDTMRYRFRRGRHRLRADRRHSQPQCHQHKEITPQMHVLPSSSSGPSSPGPSAPLPYQGSLSRSGLYVWP